MRSVPAAPSGRVVLGMLAIAASIAGVGAFAGCARTRSFSSQSIPLPAEREDDRLGVDDVFVVRVYGEQDLSNDYRVATDGTIDFPLAGRIPVQGMNVGQVQAEIVKRLKDKY